jgi:hypothetical protein
VAYSQAVSFGKKDCVLPVIRYVQFSDPSEKTLKYENISITYFQDSIHKMANPIITKWVNDSVNEFVYSDSYAWFGGNGVDYWVWTENRGSQYRILEANENTCKIRDVTFKDGEVSYDFHGDYSRPDTCILIYYENGKPSRFSEGKPYVFKMPEDSMLYHNTQYELLMTGRGWYDEEGNKYYYPPVR